MIGNSRSAIVAITAVVVVGATCARLIYDSEKAYRAGLEAIRQGHIEDAIILLRSSAMAFLPFNPFVDRAYDTLWQIGRKAEIAGDSELALAAYRAIRSSILASRNVSIPHSGWLEQIDMRIATLMARASPAGAEEDRQRRVHMSFLSARWQPSPFWSVVLALGFFLWIGSFIYFIFFGLNTSLTVSRRPAIFGLVGLCAGFMLWLAGMILA